MAKDKHISVDEAMTVLSIIGEEDSLGFEDDDDVQYAIEVVQKKVNEALIEGRFDRNKNLLTFRK